MRDVWYSTSYLLDRKQSMNGCAKKRFENYKMQPLEFAFMPGFKGKFSQYGIDPNRRTPTGIRAAIIREKGTNGEREMAYSLYLAGFDVKDVTMTDLISGRETLEDVNLIVYCGGFSNSDVLGSAKGWAGAFLFNPKAKEALDKYYAREDTLSLGVCNGCQLMMELNLINPEHKKNGKMLHNESHKFESRFLGLTIPTNRSVMFGSLSGSKLGIWVAHGEGKFSLTVPIILSQERRRPPLDASERTPWQNGCYPLTARTAISTPWIEICQCPQIKIRLYFFFKQAGICYKVTASCFTELFHTQSLHIKLLINKQDIQIAAKKQYTFKLRAPLNLKIL